MNEFDDAFVAVERCSRGSGYLRICCHGLEKVMLFVRSFVMNVDMLSLDDREFMCPVWRDGDCAVGACEWMEGRGGGGYC